MDDNCREHVKKIREDFQASQRVKDSLNNSIKALASDLYNKVTHFIFELIQNAEDNSYQGVEPSLTFLLSKTNPTGTQGANGALIIHNNEIGFSRDNVEAICAVGKTTKSKIQGYIGEKGIGFKSVFRVTSTPYIISSGYSLCLPEYDEETGLGYIVPRWINKLPSKVNHFQTNIILPLDKPDFSYAKIEEMLHDIKPQTILFLSKLKEMNIETDTGCNIKILKDDSKMPLVQILVESEIEGKEFSDFEEYLLIIQSFDKPENINQEKREGIPSREVSIAFPVNHNNEAVGKLFAYLPVRSDTGLPFLINADFILPSSREDIQDVPWNRWLMKCVADLMPKALQLLKERGFLTVDFLEIFARRLIQGAEDKESMFYPIVIAVREAFKTQELLPTDDDSYISAQNAKLASADWLRNLLREAQFVALYGDKFGWISGEIKEGGRYRDLWKYLKQELKVDEITPDNFARKVNKSFFECQTDQWFIQFYTSLRKSKDIWEKGKYYDGPLRKKPFIRIDHIQGVDHVTPFDEGDKPNAYLPDKNLIDSRLPTVKTEIASNEEARLFLFSELKIPEFDIVAEVIEHVIPKYTSPSPPKTDEHLRDIDKILEALHADSQEKRNRLKAALQVTAFILSQSSVSSDEVYRKPDVLYFQEDSLKIYFAGNLEVRFVSSIYHDSALEMFANLGVRRDVKIKKCKPDFQRYVIIRNFHGDHVRGLFGFDPEIEVEGLLNALLSPTIEKSCFIWNKIVIQNIECIRGTIEKSSRQSYENSSKEKSISKAFGCLLIERKWLPGTDGEFYYPGEISLNELPDKFKRSEELANLLAMKKDTVAKLAQEAGIKLETIKYAQALEKYPDLLEQIRSREDVKFPTRTVRDEERRIERITGILSESPQKEYEERERSVRVTRGTIAPSFWLREQYTNDEGQMVCQICKNEMPFRKRNGEYYFESVEAFTKTYLPNEHEAQWLALCPLCAAMYKEFMKEDDMAMASLKREILSMESLEMRLQLGALKTTIKFVETHCCDIKNILEQTCR